MKKKHSTATTTTSKPAASSAAAAITAMLAFHLCPIQAFQPSFLAPHVHVASHGTSSNHVVPATTTMRCSSPWEGVHNRGGSMQQFRRGFARWPAAPRFGPVIFTPHRVVEDYAPLQVRNPEVSETDSNYKLTFDLPTEVDEDGLDVAVSGRLLTIKARVTREGSSGGNPGGGPSRGGWVSRSSQTDSVARSFVLPEGISSSGVTASWIADGKVEVKFNKDTPPTTTTDTTTADSAADSSSTAILPPATSTAARDSEQSSSVGDTVKIDAGNESPPVPTASSSSGYLSSLSSAGKTSAKSAETSAEAQESPADPDAPQPPASSSADPDRRQPRSTFEAIDQEFADFAKAMWGDNLLRFPTEEEVEAAREARARKVDAAREERAMRMTAMKRATMTADIWETDEDGGAYIVKVSLPEGAARDDVKLTITPDNALRVSFSAEGRRSLSKEVRLPEDALVSETSAKFEAEDHQEEDEGEPGSEVGVASLTVSVGKAVPPQPRRVDIM